MYKNCYATHTHTHTQLYHKYYCNNIKAKFAKILIRIRDFDVMQRQNCQIFARKLISESRFNSIFRVSLSYLKLESTFLSLAKRASHNLTFVRTTGSANNISKCEQRVIFLSIEDGKTKRIANLARDTYACVPAEIHTHVAHAGRRWQTNPRRTIPGDRKVHADKYASRVVFS